jgi:malonate transporter
VNCQGGAGLSRFSRLAPLFGPPAGFAFLLFLGWGEPALAQVLDLALPFFGLIGLGFVAGRLVGHSEGGLAWMNAFIVYVALPALFFNLVSRTPVAELANGGFVALTMTGTACAFALSFVTGLALTRGDLAVSAMQGIAGAYSNIGYMGPGLTLAALGAGSAAPTALIFVGDTILLFSLLPFLMALAHQEGGGWWRTAGLVIWRIVTHPFNLATAAGILAAALQWQPPIAVGRLLTLLQGAAAPCALFGMGVMVALRPIRTITAELPILLLIKLVLHPLIVWTLLSLVGGFDRVWVFTAVLMAALPPALNVFIMASRYQTYVERASNLILVGTLLSVITVTGLLFLITSGLAPIDLLHR